MANENRKGGNGAASAARAEPPPLPAEPPQKILPPLTTPVFAVPVTDPPDLDEAGLAEATPPGRPHRAGGADLGAGGAPRARAGGARGPSPSGQALRLAHRGPVSGVPHRPAGR